MKDDALMTLPEVAAHLRVSLKTVKRRIAEKALPAIRIGGRALRVSRDDLDRFERKFRTC